jgi:DUF971 family protein
MAGIERDTPIPTEITLHQKSRRLELAYENGQRYLLDFEYLRVFTPSAEARGHGPGQETLQTGKRDVEIVSLEPVGHYAVQPTFSDGHDSGIFAWSYLYELGQRQDEFWSRYLERLSAAGVDRDAPMKAAPAGGCGHH